MFSLLTAVFMVALPVPPCNKIPDFPKQVCLPTVVECGEEEDDYGDKDKKKRKKYAEKFSFPYSKKVAAVRYNSRGCRNK